MNSLGCCKHCGSGSFHRVCSRCGKDGLNDTTGKRPTLVLAVGSISVALLARIQAKSPVIEIIRKPEPEMELLVMELRKKWGCRGGETPTMSGKHCRK